MIVILDTNVLLSAALRDRLPERVVLFVATDPDVQWLVTAEILGEYARVLRRPKFKFTAETQSEWIEVTKLRTVLADSPPVVSSFLRDPKDEPFLAAATAHHADYLVTGDRDLLDVRSSLSVEVVTISEFAKLFNIS